MKIATYNIWNSQRGLPERENQIIEEIKLLDADVLALQEVRDQDFCDQLVQATQYAYYAFQSHPGEAEGLALLSKYPILSFQYTDYALLSVIKHKHHALLFANVHLPSESTLNKEVAILANMKAIASIQSDYQFILGDFNCSETSIIHLFLKGDFSINQVEVDNYWIDLACVADEHLDIQKEMTLDLKNNPRWKGKNPTDNSSRVDTIFMHDCFPFDYPSLDTFGYFGKAVSKKSGYAASDHYGVFAELTFPYEKEQNQ